MGTQMGSNLMLMHRNHTHQDCKYIIMVDLVTGKKFRVNVIPEDEEVEG
jgi:hypothetical protein